MIYVIRMFETDFYKIGYTGHESPTRRMAQLQTACPRRLHLVATFEGDEVTEREFHRKVWQYHTDGGDEWFQIPQEAVKELISNGRQPVQNHQGSTQGTSAFDVRQVRGRQQYDPASRGKDVPERAKPVDDTRHQRVFLVDGRKLQVSD